MPDSDNGAGDIDCLRNKMQDLEKSILYEFKKALEIHNAEAYLEVDKMIEDYKTIKISYLNEINKRREFL